MKKETLFWVILVGSALLFSSWLMIHTFSYNKETSSMLIATKAWSDFGAHIPMIRSFSLGNNWPPQYPLFPGEPIRYHFLFYFFVGMLEKAGLRIDWALNIPSVIGFAGLMIATAVFAQKLFHDKRITILSVVFFLTNGSFSFLQFFKEHPLSIQSLRDIVTNTAFPSFAPWKEGEITAFWNLNIYTNQRHLALAFALAIVFISLLIYMEKKSFTKQLPFAIAEIAILALLPYFHQPILLILALFIACYLILFPKLRGILIFISVGAVFYIMPQLFPILSGPKLTHWQPWFLMQSPYTIWHAIWYWLQNIGLHLFFIPLGWLLLPPKLKKIFIPLLFLFLIPNLFQFSVEIAANHKFFNFYLILGNMLSAYILIKMIDLSKKMSFIIRQFVTSFIFLSIVALMLSGIIDFFPIANDPYMELPDIPANEVATWIKNNTPPDAVFLNSSYFFHPASIAGRKIFMGWPYFPWSAGYNTLEREHIMKTIFDQNNPLKTCSILNQYNISYVIIDQPWSLEGVPLHNPLFTDSQPLFTDAASSAYVLSTRDICTSAIQ